MTRQIHAVVEHAQYVDAPLAADPENHEMTTVPPLPSHMQDAHTGRKIVALPGAGDLGAFAEGL